MANRPTFISVGPGRCGTSWLHEILSAHPDIGISKVKETEFFNTNFCKGFDWYENHFAHLQSKKAIGEISNNYYLDAGVAKRIRAYNPAIKIIISIREPISLLRSFYEFGQRRGLDSKSICDALGEPIGKIMGSGYEFRERRNELTPADQVCLLQSVLLSNFLQPFLQHFPHEQLYFFVFERLGKDPQALLNEIYDFLGVDSSFKPEMASEVVNESISPRSKFLAHLGSKFAFFLRRAGAYRILSALHRSRNIKRIFFRRSHNTDRQIDLVRTQLDRVTLDILESEKNRLCYLVPTFAQYSDRA